MFCPLLYCLNDLGIIFGQWLLLFQPSCINSIQREDCPSYWLSIYLVYKFSWKVSCNKKYFLLNFAFLAQFITIIILFVYRYMNIHKILRCNANANLCCIALYQDFLWLYHNYVCLIIIIIIIITADMNAKLLLLFYFSHKVLLLNKFGH